MGSSNAVLTSNGVFQEFSKVESKKVIKLPLFSQKIGASVPSSIDDFHVENYLDINELLIKNKDHTFLFYVYGNSMEPEIKHGDQIIVDTLIPQKMSLEELNGRNIIACLNNEYTLKRLKLINKNIYLVPENPDFNKIKVNSYDDFRVYGLVTSSIRFLR